MNINISINSRTFYLLIGILAVLIISGISFAYNYSYDGESNASIMGHTTDELHGPNGETF
jgi:hypothetical protein